MDLSFQKIQTYTNLTRPKNTVPLALAYCIGATYAQGNLGIFDLLLGLAVVLLCKMTVTVWNDVSDFAVDQANHRVSGMHTGEISLRQARLLAIGLGLAALFAVRISGKPWLGLVYIAIFAVVGWLYNDRPVQLSHRPLASIVSLGFVYGPLPMLYGAVSGESATLSVVTFGSLLLAWFMQRSSISLLKDYKDAKGDAKHHKHTFYLHYGAVVTARSSLGLMLISALYIFVILCRALSPFGVIDWVFLLAIAGVFLYNLMLRKQLLHARNDAARARLFKSIYARQNIFDGLVLAWLIVS